MVLPAFHPTNLNFTWSLLLIPPKTYAFLWFKGLGSLFGTGKQGSKFREHDVSKILCHISTIPVAILLKCEDTFYIFMESSNAWYCTSFYYFVFQNPKIWNHRCNVDLYVNFKIDLQNVFMDFENYFLRNSSIIGDNNILLIILVLFCFSQKYMVDLVSYVCCVDHNTN